MTKQQLYTFEIAAELLDVNVRTIRRWRDSGKILETELKGKVKGKIHETEVNRLLELNKTE